MEFAPGIFMSKQMDSYNTLNNSSNILKLTEFDSAINCNTSNCGSISRPVNFNPLVNQSELYLNQLIPSCSKELSNQTQCDNNNVFMNQSFTPNFSSISSKAEQYTTNNSNNFTNETATIMNTIRLPPQFPTLPTMMLSNDDNNFQQKLCQLYGISTTTCSQNSYAPYFAAAAAANFASSMNIAIDAKNTKSTSTSPSTKETYSHLALKTFTPICSNTTSSTITSFMNTSTAITDETANFDNVSNIWSMNPISNFIPNLSFAVGSSFNENKKSN